MTHEHESSSGGESNLGPGVAPSFGDVPAQPFEHTPERIVLSRHEHTHLAHQPLATLGGEFAHEQIGRGVLALTESGAPGEVHIRADVLTLEGPAIHLEADVRGSWVARTASGNWGEAANVQIVRELVRLAALPHQSTVRVRQATAKGDKAIP
jgi:hypothetical protein